MSSKHQTCFIRINMHPKKKTESSTTQISGSQLSAVGGGDPSAEHQGPRSHLRPAAGAPADHPGEVHGLQGAGDLFPAQVSEEWTEGVVLHGKKSVAWETMILGILYQNECFYCWRKRRMQRLKD